MSKAVSEFHLASDRSSRFGLMYMDLLYYINITAMDSALREPFEYGWNRPARDNGQTARGRRCLLDKIVFAEYPQKTTSELFKVYYPGRP